MSWLCKCGLVNSGLNTYCANLAIGQHVQVTLNQPDYSMSVVASKGLTTMNTDDREELFIKFFNHEKILVKDMNDIDLSLHIDELERIVLEAKARISSADSEKRERRASKGNKEWLTTVTAPDQSVSDAINSINIRQKRMSKMDKIRKQLLDTGIDEKTVDEMVRQMEKKATDSQVRTLDFSQKAKTVTPKQTVTDNTTGKPFDWSSITKE